MSKALNNSALHSSRPPAAQCGGSATAAEEGAAGRHRNRGSNWGPSLQSNRHNTITPLALSSTRAECALQCSPSACAVVRRLSPSDRTRSSPRLSATQAVRPLTDALSSPPHLMLTVRCLLAMYPSDSSFRSTAHRSDVPHVSARGAARSRAIRCRQRRLHAQLRWLHGMRDGQAAAAAAKSVGRAMKHTLEAPVCLSFDSKQWRLFAAPSGSRCPVRLSDCLFDLVWWRTILRRKRRMVNSKRSPRSNVRATRQRQLTTGGDSHCGLNSSVRRLCCC